MKHVIRTVMILLLAFTLAFEISGAAFASGFNNTIKDGPAQSGAYSGGPSYNDFNSASNSRYIEKPNASAFLRDYYVMYVNAPKGHSIYARDYWSFNEANKTKWFAYHGSRVVVIAEQGEFSCALFHDIDNSLKVAWLCTRELSSWYPGRTVSLCLNRNNVGTRYTGEVPVSWSYDTFYRTNRKYTVLDTPCRSCTGFMLDYQLTSRNGAETESVLGPRDLYINDGSGWEYIGSFDYNEREAVHVEVTLAKPFDLVAVATIANCAAPDTFVIRQSLVDVWQQ